MEFTQIKTCPWVCGAIIGSLLMAVGGCGGSSGTTSASKAEGSLVAATKAIAAGDDATAMAELTASIGKSPSTWAYFERARIHLKQGREDEAKADCQKGLELDAEDSKLKWLSAELQKPSEQRFQGALANPPSRDGR